MMNFRLLFLAIATPTLGFAQEKDPPASPPSKPLRAKPSRDLFDLATLYYNNAQEEKDPEKKKVAYKLAAKKFDSFLRAFPKDKKALETWYFLALCYQQVGETKASRTCFEAAATSWNSGQYVAGAALHLASDDYEKKQWKSAAKWFRILAKTTDQPKVKHEALYRRFLCFRALKMDTMTIPALNEVLEDKGSPYLERARHALAQLYQKKNQHRQAHQQFVELAKSRDGKIRADAILQSALTAQKLNDAASCKLWFGKALIEPGLKEWRAQSQLALMNLHYRDKEWPKVIAIFNKGRFKLEKEPALQRLIMAAKSYEALGNKNEVSKLYDEIAKISPESVSGFQAGYRKVVQDHQKKARSFAKNTEEFLKQYGETHKKDPKVQTARLLIAEHHYDKKDYRRAFEHYSEIRLGLIDETNRLVARYHRARSALALKLEKESLEAITAFLKAYPRAKQRIGLLKDRAELFSTLGRHDEALKDYEEILKSTKDQKLRIAILKRLGADYHERKDYPRFASIQRKILQQTGIDNKTRASANFWIGWNDYRSKKFDEALPYLIQARELDPAKFTTQVGPLLVRSAYKAEDVALLEKEINTLRKRDAKAPLPKAITRWLGATLSKNGHHRRAFPFLKEGLDDKEATISSLIWKLYAQAALETKHFNEALNAADRVLEAEKSPFRKAEALHLKSQALVGLKKFKEARQATSDALDFRPQGELDLHLRMHAGEIDLVAGQPGEALRHFVLVESLYAKTKKTQKAAAQKIIICLEAIGTPEAIKKIPEYQAKLK